MSDVTSKPRYQVIVGNVGQVYDGVSAFDAYTEYNRYMGQSKRGYGRAAGEPVTMFRDNEITAQYEGEA